MGYQNVRSLQGGLQSWLVPGANWKSRTGFATATAVNPSSDARTEHSWEPMLPWPSGQSSDLPEPSLKLSPCTRSDDATA